MKEIIKCILTAIAHYMEEKYIIIPTGIAHFMCKVIMSSQTLQIVCKKKNKTYVIRYIAHYLQEKHSNILSTK